MYSSVPYGADDYERECVRIILGCARYGKDARATVAWLRALGKRPRGQAWHVTTIRRIWRRYRWELPQAA